RPEPGERTVRQRRGGGEAGGVRAGRHERQRDQEREEDPPTRVVEVVHRAVEDGPDDRDRDDEGQPEQRASDDGGPADGSSALDLGRGHGTILPHASAGACSRSCTSSVTEVRRPSRTSGRTYRRCCTISTNARTRYTTPTPTRSTARRSPGSTPPRTNCSRNNPNSANASRTLIDRFASTATAKADCAAVRKSSSRWSESIGRPCNAPA